MKKRRVALLIFIALIVLGSIGTVMLLDFPYTLRYTVSLSETKPNTLDVVMEVDSPRFFKSKNVAFYTGDKSVTLRSCADEKGRAHPVRQKETAVELPLGRAEKAFLTYEVQLASLGKHGYRGYSSENFCAFDGGQAFLLPMEFYQEGYPPNRTVVGSLSITLKTQSGWTQVIPYTELKNVVWRDAYNLNNNGFFMGRSGSYTLAGEKGGLKIYAAGQDGKSLSGAARDGIATLYDYYAGLFSLSGKPYQVILLPPGGESGASVIGGAGTGSVCSTFDPGSKRDWELLSHRMFHAYFDTVLPAQEFHAAPRLWLYEGLATYYENRSMGKLPPDLQTALGIRPEQQFTSLFNKYLYIRMKEPALFSLTPMEEKEVTESDGGSAKIEFLHYIQAPLVVRLTEDLISKRTGTGDTLLSELLKDRGHSGPPSCRELLSRVLGAEAEGVYQKYFLSNSLLPLWYLRDSGYPEQRTLADLNDMDYLLATWLAPQTGKIPYEKLDLATVQKIRDRPEWRSAHFSDSRTEQEIRDYSPVIDALLREFALRAKICHVPWDDPSLRYKLLLDADNRNKWSTWVKSAVSS